MPTKKQREQPEPPKKRGGAVTISPELYERIGEVARARGVPIKEVADEAIAAYLDGMTPAEKAKIAKILELRGKL